MTVDPHDHYCQVWEGDYGDRDDFIRGLSIINSNIPIDVLTGMTIHWSDIPYSLNLFVCLFVSSDQSNSAEVLLEISQILQQGGGKLRTDITNAQLMSGIGQRQLNMISAVQGVPVVDPCALPTKNDLKKKGYDFTDWRASNRVFLSHQNQRKPQVSLLQQLLASQGVATWMDIHDIEIGEPLARAIDRGIDKSTAVIFWISDAFLRSEWCRFEFDGFLDKYASQRHVRLFSIVEEGCEDRIPRRLKTLKYLRVSNPGDPRVVAKEVGPALRSSFLQESEDWT